MRVYMVRHAESRYNARRIHQDSAVRLSDEGVRQAGLLAERLRGVRVDALISSPYERARQTATFIGRAVGRPIHLTPLLAEMKRPSTVEGRAYDDPDAVAIKIAIEANYHLADWRHSDEETFADLRDRAVRCLEYIVGLGQDNVVAVTHGGLMTMLVAVMRQGSSLRPRDFLRLRLLLQAHNTGISVCDYESGLWRLVTWNDCAHLTRTAE